MRGSCRLGRNTVKVTRVVRGMLFVSGLNGCREMNKHAVQERPTKEPGSYGVVIGLI